MKNPKRSMKKAKMAQEAQKMRKNAKNEPNMAPRSPQEEMNYFNGGLRVPLPADHLSWENEGKSILVHDSSRWGVDPRAL